MFSRHFDQFQQILRARDGAPARLLNEWILRPNIRPVGWHKGSVPVL
jgi:hypothetical protein